MSELPGIDAIVDENVMIPMRDGVRLQADVIRPPAADPRPRSSPARPTAATPADAPARARTSGCPAATPT